MTDKTKDDVIRCEGVWKIFGGRSKDAMAAVLEQGLSKEEVRDRYNCVVGVKDAPSASHAARFSASWACRVRANRP